MMSAAWIGNTMTVDGLATEGARASAAMVLTCLSRIILVSAPARLGKLVKNYDSYNLEKSSFFTELCCDSDRWIYLW